MDVRTVDEIKHAVEQLGPADFQAFRAWFLDHGFAKWDRQIEADVAAGTLDAIMDEAVADGRRRRRGT